MDSMEHARRIGIGVTLDGRRLRESFSEVNKVGQDRRKLRQEVGVRALESMVLAVRT